MIAVETWSWKTKKKEQQCQQITSKVDTNAQRIVVYWRWGITSSSACKNVLRSSLCCSSWCDAILFTNTSNACRLISMNSALKRNFSATKKNKSETQIELWMTQSFKSQLNKLQSKFIISLWPEYWMAMHY